MSQGDISEVGGYSEYIGTGRSVKGILKATKTVLKKPESAKAFDSFLEKRKPVQTISSPLTTRIESEGVSVEVTQDSSSKMAAKQSASTDTSNQKPEGRIVSASNGVSSGREQDTWSETQERALIQALKTFPKDINQHWERVAAAVPGRTLIQCRRKFLPMKENFRNKKNVEQ